MDDDGCEPLANILLHTICRRIFLTHIRVYHSTICLVSVSSQMADMFERFHNLKVLCYQAKLQEEEPFMIGMHRTSSQCMAIFISCLLGSQA